MKTAGKNAIGEPKEDAKELAAHADCDSLMPSHGDTNMPPGVAQHVKALCKALDLLVKSRKLTQKQAAAKSGLTVHKVKTLLGKNKAGGIDCDSLCKLVWACEMTPGEFFAAVYGFKPAEDLQLLPTDGHRRITKLREILDQKGLLPLPDLHDDTSPGPTLLAFSGPRRR
jgi:hypothetical protein